MSFAGEFAAVDWLVQSDLETSGVDAFALALIKAERQIRRIFTYVVFQNEAFGCNDVASLRDILGKNRRCYFEGFERGINATLQTPIEVLVGVEYQQLRPLLDEAIEARNKIFHGQLTNRRLSRADLLAYVATVRRWCELLATGAASEIGYDGFERNSFRKGLLGCAAQYKAHLADLGAYEQFLKDHVAR